MGWAMQKLFYSVYLCNVICRAAFLSTCGYLEMNQNVYVETAHNLFMKWINAPPITPVCTRMMQCVTASMNARAGP